MKRIFYILIAFVVTSCSFQHPKLPPSVKSYRFNLSDTIYEDGSTIMIIRTDSSMIWEHTER